MKNNMDDQQKTPTCSHCGHKIDSAEDYQKEIGNDSFTTEKEPTTSKTQHNISTYSTLAIAILTFVLVAITAYYAWQTNKLSNIAKDQMLLSAEPNIDFISDDFNKIEAGKIKFDLLNQSPVKLINLKLTTRYYTHLIDSNLQEYILSRGAKLLVPNKIIEEIGSESKVPIELDYKLSGLTSNQENVSFFLGSPPNVKEYTLKDINRFYARTYAEYKIDFQRGIDGKHYSKTFYYLIILQNDPNEARFLRQTKEEIFNSNRETARVISLIKSAK